MAVHEETEQFHYFVTARHLVRPLNRDGSERESVDGTILVRLSRGTNTPFIQKTIRSEWVCPTDCHIDLAIFPFDYRAADQGGDLHFHAFIVISPNHSILYDEQPYAHGKMRMGDDVFIPSVFSGHVGEQQNIPVIRFGHVASLPMEPMRFGSPTVPAFLIETRSLGGTSGAPVLLHLNPSAPRNSPPGHESGNIRMVPYALIGMVLGAHGGNYGRDFAAEPDGTIVNADAQFNAGLSLVLPMQHVIDLLQSEVLARPAATALEKIETRCPASGQRRWQLSLIGVSMLSYRYVSRLPSIPFSTISARCASFDSQLRAVVVAEIKLRQVARQVLLVHVLVGADQSALEEAEMALQRVGVNIAAHPLELGMVDRFVLFFGGHHELVRLCAIGH